ncbi:MAG: OsmC family protein [Solirubrobacteraceae bacterium]|nr:OsmC family protein [Patulibacter sp.]
MRAVSTSQGGLRHLVSVGDHHLIVDEPVERGGTDTGPSPLELLAASLVSCTAITMQLYAKRKGWELDDLTVEVDYQPAERGALTQFEMILGFPDNLSDEQVEKLKVIAAKCPIHRTLEGEAIFTERVERRARA